jgi:regulator of replication initiation timing
LIVGNIEVNRAISEEDLKDAIEVGTYDELGLDSATEYIIKYFEVHISSSQNRVFNVFAIPTYKLLEIFDDIGSIKHIDFLAPTPLLYSGLYKKEYLERGKVDCFVHFDYDDAYLVIYNDGEYVYSKSLTHSLKKINEEFAKLLARHIDEKEFFELLKHQGLMTADSLVQKNLMKIFSDVFNYVNDVLQFAKRSNDIAQIDNFFITSKIGDIKGLVEFATNYTNLVASKLELKISKNSSEVSLDPLVEIMIVYAKEYINEKDDGYNFSLFKKEPDFFTRPSGKLVKTIAASLILSLSYPIYQIYETYMFEQQYNRLSIENQRLRVQVDAMKQALKNVLAEKKSIEDKLKSKNKDLEFRTKLLQEIYNKKVNYGFTNLFTTVSKWGEPW